MIHPILSVQIIMVQSFQEIVNCNQQSVDSFRLHSHCQQWLCLSHPIIISYSTSVSLDVSAKTSETTTVEKIRLILYNIDSKIDIYGVEDAIINGNFFKDKIFVLKKNCNSNGSHLSNPNPKGL